MRGRKKTSQLLVFCLETHERKSNSVFVLQLILSNDVIKPDSQPISSSGMVSPHGLGLDDRRPIGNGQSGSSPSSKEPGGWQTRWPINISTIAPRWPGIDCLNC